VRKISGFTKPSKANEGAFQGAVNEIAAVSIRLMGSLERSAPAKNRVTKAAKTQMEFAIGAGEVGGEVWRLNSRV
jgi:hypothetical protein